METKDIVRSIEETKDLIRRVRTPAGVRRFGQPIGTIIKPDMPEPRAPRRGTRRAASTEADKNPPNRSQRRRRAATSVTTTDARVAPEAEYQQTDDSYLVDFGAQRKKRWWVNPDPKKRQKYYQSEAPFRERVNFDFLNNGTAKEAKKILDDFGVQYKTTPKYKQLAKDADSRLVRGKDGQSVEPVGGDSYRDFMVSLAESVRLMESEFPGWSKIHGRIYTEGTQKRGATAYNFPYRGSRTTDAPQPLRDQMRGMVSDIYLGGDQVLKDKPPSTTQTATVFGPGMLTWLRDEFHGTFKPRVGMDVQWNTAGDGLQYLADGSNHRVAQMMNTILHEFGHATAASVSGDIAPDLDDRADMNAGHRRWYKEYYAEALMKFYSDNGVIEWTGKQPNYDYLMDYAKQLKHYDEATERFNTTGNLESFREDAEKGGDLVEKAKESRAKSGAAPFTHAGRANDFQPWVRRLYRDGYIKSPNYSVDALMAIAPSTYAATKPVEIEAESWVSYMFDTEASKGATEWGRTMHEMMTWYMDDVDNPDFNTTNMDDLNEE